jgi:hypothetical protein
MRTIRTQGGIYYLFWYLSISFLVSLPSTLVIFKVIAVQKLCPKNSFRPGGKTTNQKLAFSADTSWPTTSTPYEDKQHLHKTKRNIQSAETGVCSSCYDLLTKSDEDFVSFKYHSDFPTLVESSTTCPCCLILIQSFRIQDYKAGHPQNNRRNVRACDKAANSEYRGLTLERGTFTQDDIFTNEFGCEVNFCTSEGWCFGESIH